MWIDIPSRRNVLSTDIRKTHQNIYDSTVRIVKIMVFVFGIVTLIGVVFFSTLDDKDMLSVSAPVHMEHWTVTDPEGNTFEAGRIYQHDSYSAGAFTLTSVLPDKIEDDSALCMSVGGDFEVYIGDELRADFIQSRDFAVPGGIVKRFYFVTPLKSTDSGAPVKVIRTSTTRRGYVYQDAFVASRVGVYAYLMIRYGLAFVLAFILTVFSLILAIVSLVMRLVYKQKIAMLYGSLGIFVVSAWIVTNSYLYPFVFGHYHIDGIANYILCLLMPFNLIFYLDSLQNGRYRKIMSGVLLSALASLIIWPALHFLSIYSLMFALPYINLLLGLQVLVVMCVMVIDLIRGRVKDYRFFAIGFLGFLICGLGEIYMLNFTMTMHEEIPMLIGLAFLLILAVIQQVEDMNRLRDERQKAMDLSEAKTRFLTGMSHEIRTPINAILGMNEMIIRENKDKTIGEYARYVKSSGEMLLMLVNDVLDFSKIEAGKTVIQKNRFYFSSLLKDIMPMLKERADKKELTLDTVVGDNVPDGQISDEFRIKQILINVINNAIKYTDNGSITLTVDGEYTGEEEYLLKLSVKDTGRGIRKEDQKGLFEAFNRVDLKNNRSIEGTGLGLAIVKSIVDSMNGDISVISEYGKGSEFRITLPVSVADKTALRSDYLLQAEAMTAMEDGCDYTAPEADILAVDDNNSNLMIVKYFLKRPEITPDTCDNGLEAVNMCKKKKYDLILLDHMMPDPDGIETLGIIRNDPDSLNRETPVIVLTANAVAGSREIYMKAGFADYITKPIEASFLEQTIRKYLPDNKIITK